MSDKTRHEDVSRRDFLQMGTAAGVGVGLSGLLLANCTQGLKKPPVAFRAAPMDTVRIGYVGVGGMGTAHMSNLLRIEGVEIKAVCDIVESRVARAQKMTVDAGFKKPDGYSNGEWDFKNLCQRDDIDLIYTATPWEWHVPVCVEAMEMGKHAATEVPAAVTLDECWQLVETSERTKKYCVMMENCCYDRQELLILNLVRKGMLGELINAECGYLHDLRHVKTDFEAKGEAVWRLEHSKHRNGNLYPTHGLGPVAQCMNINRGDLFDYLVSMSSMSRGLNLWCEKQFGPDHELTRQRYALGDVNVSLIRTKLGRTITVWHDCSSPRPYSRIDLVQGTRGIARKYPDRIYIEGKSPSHSWEEFKEYYAEHEHPLWKTLTDKSRGAGHGGMDYIEDYRLIKCLREGLPLDMDVYDAAALSAVSELSERSVAKRSRSMDFPDFTRGLWKTREPLGIVLS
jgi:hypothetical protein